MDKNALILLIQENSADTEYLRRVLLNGEGGFRVQPVERVRTALARIAGGGVDLAVLDLSLSKNPEIEKLDTLLKLRSEAPQVPIVVVYDSEDDSPLMRAVRAGAEDYLPRARCNTDLNAIVRSAIGRRPGRFDRPHVVPDPRKAGAVTTLLGGKGGVGATTVALNLAAALAKRGKVILTELRPMFGTLSPYLRPHPLAGNNAHLLRADPDAIVPAEIEACLWSFKEIPGLNILFGPQTAEQCREVAAHSAVAIVKALAALADYVVVDLQASLSEANRAVIRESDSLLLVVERDPLCIDSAKRTCEAIHVWKAVPPFIGAVIVNRAPLAAPMDLAEIEMRLAIPTVGVIPPASDLCIAAQKAAMPLLLFDPDSIAAHSFTGLAETLATPSRKPARAS